MANGSNSTDSDKQGEVIYQAGLFYQWLCSSIPDRSFLLQNTQDLSLLMALMLCSQAQQVSVWIGSSTIVLVQAAQRWFDSCWIHIQWNGSMSLLWPWNCSTNLYK